MAVGDGDDIVVRLVQIASEAFMESLRELDFAMRKKITERVRHEFAGDSVYVRKALGAQKAKRDEAMQEDRAAGLSIRAIARKHNLGKSQTARLLKDDD